MCQNGAGFSTNARKLGQVPNRFEFNMAVHVYVDRVWLVLYIYIYVCMYMNNTKPLLTVNYGQGAVSIRKTVLPGMAIPMLKIRRPNGRLIFNMEIAIRR